MNAVVALILIGALGFLVGRFLFLRPRPGSWVERFFLSGAEFLILGALLGPSGLKVLDLEAVLQLEPFVILALSWVGLLVGLQLRWRHLAHFPYAYFRVATIQGMAAMAVAFGILVALFALWTPIAAEATDRWRAALLLAAVAAMSSPTEAALHAPGGARAGHGPGLLRFVTAFDPVLAVGGIAILFSVWHVSTDVLAATPAAWQWALISLGGGLALGAVFVLLLRTTGDTDEVMLLVLGMAVFSGGLASVFHLSPLVVCLVTGIVIGNSGHNHDRLIPIFLRVERPLYVALLVLAGMVWRWNDPWGYGLAAIFIVVRFAAKYAGVRIALAATPLPFRPASRWWLGLLPQGAMAIAVAVSYLIVYRDPLSWQVFAAIMVSTMALTLVSGRLVKTALDSPEKGEA